MDELFVGDTRETFRMYKDLADRAVAQLSTPELLFKTLLPGTNSVAIVMKHVGGNLRSRWTEFLTTDGEKPDRERDGEFLLTEKDTAETVTSVWEAGWSSLFSALDALTLNDLQRSVPIRGESYRVPKAMLRSLTHTTYHCGQIVYLCRVLVQDDWEWLSIPPGQSATYKP